MRRWGITVVCALALAAPLAFATGGQGRVTRVKSTGDYDFVHVHLATRGRGDSFVCFKHTLPPPTAGGGREVVDWAQDGVPTGFCMGNFKDGTEPFTSRYSGITTWSRTDKAIRVTVYLGGSEAAHHKGVECYLVPASRSTGECYTAADQKGKPKGQEGGPLSLFVASGDYLLLRGFCAKDNNLCHPHTVEFNRPWPPWVGQLARRRPRK